MKHFVILLIALTVVRISNAQFYENNGIYLSSEINTGNYTIGIDFNLNYTYKEKYSFKLGYLANLSKPESKPEDYIPGIEKVLSFGLFGPFDEIVNYQMGLGKIYKLNDAGKARLNLSLGFAYSKIRNIISWQKRNTLLLTSNYAINYRSYNTGSLIINPKLEFPIVGFYGLTVSPILVINKYETYFGIGVGQIIGIIKKKN
nr:hypothetical protein [uncultured Allomuricauda sp.]